MSTSTVKIKAIILIAMLAGSEAVRLKSMAGFAKQTRVLTRNPDQNLPADKQWRNINVERCSWKGVGCTGDGCLFRPLPLDRTLSSSCRLTNSKMLESNDSIQFFTDLHSQILLEKAEKFKRHCTKGNHAIQTMVCLRRAAHMLQASEFITMQRKQMLMANKAVLSKAEAAKQEKTLENAMQAMANTLGEDGLYVMKFRTKLMRDPIQILQNPKGSAQMMTDVMLGLTSDNSSRKQKAQDIVDKMSDVEAAPLTKEGVKTIKRAIDNNPIDVALAEKEERQTWRDIEVAFLPDRGVSQATDKSKKTGETASLLDVKGITTQSGKVKGLGRFIMIILWILLIASLIVALLAIAGLWGTGTGYAILLQAMTGAEFLTILQVAGGIFLSSAFAQGLLWRKIFGPKKVRADPNSGDDKTSSKNGGKTSAKATWSKNGNKTFSNKGKSEECRCGEEHDPTKSCQCSSVCHVFKNCCSNYQHRCLKKQELRARDHDTYRVLSYNICWGCMEGDSGDSTAMKNQLKRVCSQYTSSVGAAGENGMGLNVTRCASNIGEAVAKYHIGAGGYDLMAFQEASNFEDLTLSRRGVLMEKVEFGAKLDFNHVKGIHAGRPKKSWVVSAYDRARMGVHDDTVKAVLESDSGRPYLMLIFDDKQLIFINLHNAQPGRSVFRRRLWGNFLEEMDESLQEAFAKKKLRRHYRVILAGDFNDLSGKLPGSLVLPWNGAKLHTKHPFAKTCCTTSTDTAKLKPGDYIFDSKYVTRSRVPRLHDMTKAQSDHMPVEAVLGP